MTPIFDRLVEQYGSENLTGFKAELYLEDWYHDRGYDTEWEEYDA